MADTDPIAALPWEDPYPGYHRLRALSPVLALDDGGRLVTGYEACLSTLRDPSASNDLRHERTCPMGDLDRFDSFLYRDPPEHTRVRRLVISVLRAYPMEAALHDGAEVAARLLDEVAGQHGMEAVGEFADPLPARLTARLFGIPGADCARIADWARSITLSLEPTMLPKDIRRRVLALYDFADYLRDLISRRRSDPGPDLLSRLIHGQTAQGPLTDDEIIATSMLFFAALFSSAVDILANMVAAMALNPGQYRRVRAEPGLVESAVEEVLRFETPLQVIHRIVTADLVLEGHPVAAGTRLTLLLGAVNRDPARFKDPDSFDVGRLDNRHLAFGFGLHGCLGVSIARPWAQATLRELVRRIPELVPAGDFTLRPIRAFRGFERLPVRW